MKAGLYWAEMVDTARFNVGRLVFPSTGKEKRPDSAAAEAIPGM